MNAGSADADSWTHRLKRFALARKRLVAAVAAAAATYGTMSAFELNSRLLATWDMFAAVYLILALHLAMTTDEAGLQRRARKQDDGRVLILWLTIGASCFSVVAIFQELGGLKDMSSAARTPHLALAGLTIILSWLLIHMAFSLHYAHDYFDADENSQSGYRGGLHFPGDERPDYWDFVHFSYTIGVAAQTADISILTKRMRRIVTLHAIISFVFNTTMIALAVNIAASLA